MKAHATCASAALSLCLACGASPGETTHSGDPSASDSSNPAAARPGDGPTGASNPNDTPEPAPVRSGSDPGDPAVEPPIDEPPPEGYTATRYPIVLIPGLFGFRELFGAVAYFHGIPETIEESGGRAFVVEVSQSNSSETRAQQIIPQLEEVSRLTGAKRLNLVAHSQGSLDARYIAAIRPELVASITSVGGPHKGSPVADFVLKVPLGANALEGLSDLVKLVSGSSNPNDGRAALETLSTARTAEFNAKYPAGVPTSDCGVGDPEVNGIRFFSWSGVGGLTNAADLLDPTFLLSGTMIVRNPNDGLVEKCSAHFGEVIRDDYLANHADLPNLIAGLVSPFGPNPKTLFRTHANRLKNAGL